MPSRDVLVGVGLFVALSEVAAGVAGIALFGPEKIALLGVVSGVATFVLSLAVRPLLEPRPPSGGSGGAPARPPDEPPPWWPEFEAGFRAHVRDRERLRA